MRLFRLERQENVVLGESDCELEIQDKGVDQTSSSSELVPVKKSTKGRSKPSQQKPGSRQPQKCTICASVLSSRGALTKHMIIHQVCHFRICDQIMLLKNYITLCRRKNLSNAKSAARTSTRRGIWKRTKCRDTAMCGLTFVVYAERVLCTNPTCWSTWAITLMSDNSNATIVVIGFKHSLLWWNTWKDTQPVKTLCVVFAQRHLPWRPT